MRLTDADLSTLKTLSALLAEPTELRATTPHGQHVINTLRDLRKDLPQVCERIARAQQIALDDRARVDASIANFEKYLDGKYVLAANDPADGIVPLSRGIHWLFSGIRKLLSDKPEESHVQT